MGCEGGKEGGREVEVEGDEGHVDGVGSLEARVTSLSSDRTSRSGVLLGLGDSMVGSGFCVNSRKWQDWLCTTA